MSTMYGDFSFTYSLPEDNLFTSSSINQFTQNDHLALPYHQNFDPTFFDFPSTPPTVLPLSIQQTQSSHARSASHSSVFGNILSTPSLLSTSIKNSCAGSPLSSAALIARNRRSSPAVHQNGPLLLPKIRSQDQSLSPTPSRHIRSSKSPVPVHQSRTLTAPAGINKNRAASTTSSRAQSADTPSYLRSAIQSAVGTGSTSPEITAVSAPDVSSMNINMGAYLPMAFSAPSEYLLPSAMFTSRDPSPLVTSVTTSPQPIAAQPVALLEYTASPVLQPSMLATTPTAALAITSTGPTINLATYLATPNPPVSCLEIPNPAMRDPHSKHFWWDARQIKPWTSFNLETILSFPGARDLLSYPIPTSLLPALPTAVRHPHSEADLLNIFNSTLIPKLNAALSLSTPNPLILAPAANRGANINPKELLLTATTPRDASTAAHLFSGKPSARIVGLIRAFDRFNTAQRVEGNIKHVEFLRHLAALHHAMREHGTRYGFIMTEIEIIFVRTGTELTPHFGFLEVASVQLDDIISEGNSIDINKNPKFSALLALWGLCMMASDDPVLGQAHYRTEIGAPAEGMRRKTIDRDNWMPPPQLAEKREAKRSRGWIFPEEPVGRKELGKRGVKY